MPRIQRLILAIVLLGLSGYVGILLYANHFASSIHSDIKAWEKNRVIPDDESWQDALDSIQAAIKYDPNNPEYLGYEAELYLYKAIMQDIPPSKAIAAYREALSKYQQLLTLRPSWAPYWASVISIKYELWEYDELMISALNNAAHLAPWFKSNQHIILRAGFHGWPFIDLETREVINKTLERAMQLQPRETISMAFNQGFSDRVIPFIKADEVLKGLYEKELKKMGKKLLKAD